MTQLDERQEDQANARAIGAEAMARRMNPVEAISELEILGTTAALNWIKALAQRSDDAKPVAIEALVKNGTKEAAERLGWLAYDHHEDAAKIIEALKSFDPEIGAAVIQAIEHRQFERAVSDLNRAIDHKNDFNRQSAGNSERFDGRIFGLALKIAEPSEFKKHLDNKSELPDLRAALRRAVNSVPVLRETPEIKTAIAQLALEP